MRIYLTVLLFFALITSHCQQTKIQFGTPSLSGSFVIVPIIVTENTNLISYFNFIGSYSNTYAYHSYIASSDLLNSNSNIFTTIMFGEFNIVWMCPNNPLVLHDTIMKLKFINTSADCGDFIFDTVTPNHQCYIANLENDLPVIFTNYFCIPTNIRETPNDIKPEFYSYCQFLKIQNPNCKSIEIFDVLGRSVLKNSLTKGYNQFYFNRKGIFLTRLTTFDNKIIVHKFEIPCQ